MKSQVKILFVLTQGHWGGAQKYVLDLATHLPAEYEIHIALGKDEQKQFLDHIPSNSKIQFHSLTHLKREISPLQDFLAVFELNHLYKTLKPDIVHLNSSKAGALGSLAATPHTKIVYTAHGWVFLEPLSPLRKILYRLAEKYTASKKDAIIVLSESEKIVAQKQLHIPEQKLFSIPLGIAPISFLNPIEAREKLSAYDPNLKRDKTWSLTLANHYKTKGLDIFIEAVHRLSPDTKENLQCIIIGDGPERMSLKEKIKKYNLETQVFLLPFIDEASKFLRAADFFVLPSRKEGLPYVLQEALQAHLPLLATKVGGIPELLKNTPHTTLIPSEDIDALQQAIAEFLQNPKTSSVPNKKESLGNSLSSLVEKTLALYTQLIQE